MSKNAEIEDLRLKKMREVILGAGFHDLAAPKAPITASIKLGVWQRIHAQELKFSPNQKEERGFENKHTHAHFPVHR